MRLVFFDTVGLVALWDKSDQWHPEAARAYELLKQTPFVGLSSSCVLLECANAASRRPYRELLIRLRKDLSKKNMLIEPTEDQTARAWLEFEQGHAGGPSVIDLTSFEIMRRLGVSEVFSNDRHFEIAGFTTLF